MANEYQADVAVLGSWEVDGTEESQRLVEPVKIVVFNFPPSSVLFTIAAQKFSSMMWIYITITIMIMLCCRLMTLK